MTGRDLANLEAAIAMLQTGRTLGARELLAQVIRDNGGTVPPLPPPNGSPPPPAPEPEPMRASA